MAQYTHELLFASMRSGVIDLRAINVGNCGSKCTACSPSIKYIKEFLLY